MNSWKAIGKQWPWQSPEMAIGVIQSESELPLIGQCVPPLPNQLVLQTLHATNLHVWQCVKLEKFQLVDDESNADGREKKDFSGDG